MPKFRGCTIFRTRVIRQWISLKIIVFSMDTPYWSHSEGIQHGDRKPVETCGNSLVLHCASLLHTIFASSARANGRVLVQNFRDFPQTKGHVTRSNFSCNLQRNRRCIASCNKKFTCNPLFCNCNCCVASCKKSRTTLFCNVARQVACV